MPLPEKQTAYVVTAVGQPVQQTTLPVQPPNDNEITVQIYAFSINPADCKAQDKNPTNAALPYRMGRDGSGIVVAVGNKITQFKTGDTVYGRLIGSMAEYVTLKPTSVALCGSIPMEIAAAYPVAYLSAYDPLYCIHDISKCKGQTIYIAGGGGGVGHFAVQLALSEGLTVISSGSKPESIQLMQQLGVQHIIDYSKQDVVQTIMELTNNAGCDIVYDPTYTLNSFIQSASVVKQNGIWMRLGAINQQADKQALDIVTQRGAKYDNGDLLRYMTDPKFMSQNDKLNQGYALADKLYSAGILKPYINKVFQFTVTDINTALDSVRSGRLNTGKVVVKVK